MSDREQYLSDSTRILNAARALHEHYDSVQIFCTRQCDNGDTDHWEIGCGNNYAIFGQVTMWETNVDQMFREGAAERMDEALGDADAEE